MMYRNTGIDDNDMETRRHIHPRIKQLDYN